MLQTQNPQSVSSYSLRVLKTLREIFRASLSHHWLKGCHQQLTVAKTLSKNTRVKRGFSKTATNSKLRLCQKLSGCSKNVQKAKTGPPPTHCHKLLHSSKASYQAQAHSYSLSQLRHSFLPKNLHSSIPTNSNTLHNQLRTSEWTKHMHYTASVVRTTKVYQHNFVPFLSERVSGYWPVKVKI